MKFKTIFIIFNIIIFLSFSFIFLMPLPILGFDYAKVFWGQNWLVAVIFLLVLAVLDTYFLRNWRLLRLFEREDWQGLLDYLEVQIFDKNQVSKRKIHFYITASLLLSQPDNINKLRQYLEQKRPLWAREEALSLGLPILLAAEPAALTAYFQPFSKDTKVRNLVWVRWVTAFSFMLAKNFVPAREEFRDLAAVKADPLLQLMSIYYLDLLKTTDTSLAALIQPVARDLKARHTRKEWEILVDRQREKVLILTFVNKVVEEALDWLYQSSSTNAQERSTT